MTPIHWRQWHLTNNAAPRFPLPTWQSRAALKMAPAMRNSHYDVSHRFVSPLLHTQLPLRCLHGLPMAAGSVVVRGQQQLCLSALEAPDLRGRREEEGRAQDSAALAPLPLPPYTPE